MDYNTSQCRQIACNISNCDYCYLDNMCGGCAMGHYYDNNSCLACPVENCLYCGSTYCYACS